MKQVKINDLNIQDHSTLTFIGYLCSADDAYFSWANIKNVDEKDLTDGWMDEKTEFNKSDYFRPGRCKSSGGAKGNNIVRRAMKSINK